MCVTDRGVDNTLESVAFTLLAYFCLPWQKVS